MKRAEEPVKKPGEKVAEAKAEPGKSKKQVDLVAADELVLGSSTDKTPEGYRLEIQLDQNGAGIESVLSSRYDAEFEGRKNPHSPLQLIRRDPTTAALHGAGRPWPSRRCLSAVAGRRTFGRSEASYYFSATRGRASSDQTLTAILFPTIRDVRALGAPSSRMRSDIELRTFLRQIERRST